MKQAKSGIAVGSALVIGGLLGQVAWGGDLDGTSRHTTPYRSEAGGDATAEQPAMGYGTDGISGEVDSYSLGNRSNLGAPDDSGNPGSFAGLDRDRDGLVSREEGQALGEQQWSESDVNGDGKLDATEFSAFESTAPGQK